MKFIAQVVATIFTLASFAALGQGKHVEGERHAAKYGGVVQEVKGIQYELVAKADNLAIFVEDHGTKVDTQGGSAKVTLLNGGEKSEAMLAPGGGNKLEAKGSFKVGKDTKAVAVVRLAGKSAQSVRFVLNK